MEFVGRVQAGVNDASKWLGLYALSYAEKLGHPIFPGSLNLALDNSLDFDWFHPHYASKHIPLSRGEMGGERDVLMIPCRLPQQADQMAWIWATTNAVKASPVPRVIELIAPVKLRERYALEDGHAVTVYIP